MFNKEKVKLGIAPIAWTNDDLPDLGKENTFEQCVSEMALAGFTAVSYTHLDVYKRQVWMSCAGLRITTAGNCLLTGKQTYRRECQELYVMPLNL